MSGLPHQQQRLLIWYVTTYRKYTCTLDVSPEVPSLLATEEAQKLSIKLL